MMGLFQPRRLTRLRIGLAMTIAVIADGLQVVLTLVPLADEIIDVIAMASITWLVGFHLLLLPTFVVEFIPVMDMLPTWTACTGAVIMLKKRPTTPPPPLPVEEPKRLP